MSFETWSTRPDRPGAGLLPGRPETYFLSKGEGEHAKLYTDTFSVLSGDEASSACSPRLVCPATHSRPRALRHP
jgi:hypothetical protein